jgi:hypothetical protein
MVEDNLVVHNGVIHWNVLFTQQIQDWEMIWSFLSSIDCTPFRLDMERVTG